MKYQIHIEKLRILDVKQSNSCMLRDSILNRCKIIKYYCTKTKKSKLYMSMYIRTKKY